MSPAIIEALKEFFRTTLLSTISAVITVVLTGVNATTGTIIVNWQLVLAVGLTVFLTGVLRFIDKWQYEKDGKFKMPF